MFVTILDENDNAPVFQQQLYEVTLDEGPATLNATLVTVQALDRDEGPNSTVTYAITEGNILGTFYINSTTVSQDAVPNPGIPSSCVPHSQLLSPCLAGTDPHPEGAGLRDQPRALHLGGHCHRPVPHRLASADVNHHGRVATVCCLCGPGVPLHSRNAKAWPEPVIEHLVGRQGQSSNAPE